MDKKAKSIRSDLFEIYNSFYKILNDNNNYDIFNPKLKGKFQYQPSEIAEELGLSQNSLNNNTNINKSKTKGQIKQEIADISNLEELRDYYNKNLSQLFNPENNEQINNKILNSLTIVELKYLYRIISPIHLKTGKTKKDIIYMFKNYFDDEARVNDMTKNL